MPSGPLSAVASLRAASRWAGVRGRVVQSRLHPLRPGVVLSRPRLLDYGTPRAPQAGRSRWKIENENNNTLKTKGYHLEHNFGHGKLHLSSLLACMNILAFLLHTLLDLSNETYRTLREALGSRRTFFEHVRTLTHYKCFGSWGGLLEFMVHNLELGPYDPG